MLVRQDENETSLLILDESAPFLHRLTEAMAKRGFSTTTASSVAEAKRIAAKSAPSFAIVEFRLKDGCGIEAIRSLRAARPNCRVVVLTGFASIAGAVAATKSGAADFLSKPTTPDEIAAALLAPEGRKPKLPERVMSADRVRWEHIHRIYSLCNHNASETARRLKMHRRTLQRILTKNAPP